MANRAGRIGRDGEHKTSALLRAAGFEDAEREGRRAPSLDNIASELTVPVETKRRATISLPEWVRKIVARHGDVWALFIHPRDARRKDAIPSLMVVDGAFGARLLRLYETYGRDDSGRADQ